MILNTAPQNEAILSNVGQIGEFRIRNSAKAFNILSSGLYANKIRAIIRELSCNAVDSHVAAGKSTTPFDVHLPNAIEPWFSIRDYGTGLSHAQVTNIYTTYFESTKTGSNDFIGALGLGSKSPFSYTDNFTVTAIQNGRKGIYTAFINDQGVPSIALMTESDTTEPNGVEVKFAVTDRWEFDKFRNEAQIVYVYFKLRPVVNGYKDFKFQDPTYKDESIITGVHYTGKENRSIAVMGNIAYPIDVPQADTSLGNLRSLLNCGLVLEFDIGELDFQASREGLSYIPTTVQSIKRKLEALNSQLAVHIAGQADKFTNLWDRAEFLETKAKEPLWRTAVSKYVADTKFPLSDGTSNYSFLKPFTFKEDELASTYNIRIRAFSKDRGRDKCNELKTQSIYDDTDKKHFQNWRFYPHKTVYFVITDTKRGALERAKYHWRNTEQNQYSNSVVVLEAADKNKPMNTKAFFKTLYNPPENQRLLASTLLEKERTGGGNWGKASILKLEDRERARRQTTVVWANAGTASKFDTTKTYYYVELKGWDAIGLPCDAKSLKDYLYQTGIYSGDIYGVRQSDAELVRKQKNWVRLNDYVLEKLQKVDTTNVMGLVKSSIDFNMFSKYITNELNTDSPFYKLYAEFKDVQGTDSRAQSSLEGLFKLYNIQTNQKVDVTKLVQEYREKVEELKQRYPLIGSLSYYVEKRDVVSYINMVDQVKGI